MAKIRSLASNAKLSFEGLTLKTDENVTTISGLKISTDKNLAIISQNINDLISTDKKFSDQLDEIRSLASDVKLSFEGQETRIKSIEDLAVVLQAQIDEIKVETRYALSLQVSMAQIEANKTDIDYLKLLLGVDRVKDTGSINLLGSLEASEVVAGVFTVKITDKKRKTIGEVMIKEEEDSVEVKTKSVTETCKIFTSFSDNPGAYSWIEKVKNGDGDYTGFKIKLASPVAKDVKVSWWIVEEK